MKTCTIRNVKMAARSLVRKEDSPVEYGDSSFLDDFDDYAEIVPYGGDLTTSEPVAAFDTTYADAYRASTQDVSMCSRCAIQMIYDDETSYYICMMCHKERKVIGEGTDDGNENATTNGVGLTGVAARSSNKSTIRAQQNKIYSDFASRNLAFSGNKIPADVYNAAARLFIDATTHLRTKRGRVRRQLMAACQEIKCLEMKCPRKQAEICEIYNVPKGYTDGITVLNDLATRGLIVLPCVSINNSDVYLDRYFELLKIPDRYKEFICQILAESNKGSSIIDFKINSRVAGCILVLAQKLQMDIKTEMIERECSVKRDTFSQFTEAILNSYKYKKILDKYGIVC